jgi:dTDP-glucose 4,6-dehydratase
MRILITGSKGVIGSKLFEVMNQRGHLVFGLDLYHTNDIYGHDLGSKTGENYSRCDISEYRQIQAIIKHFKPELVYNCAAEFGRWNGEHFYEKIWKSNVIGTKNIIRLQEETGFKLVHCSSSEVYGDYNGVMYEDVMNKIAIAQMNDYAMSKWVNEMQIMNSQSMYGTESVRVRFFNTYGPGEWYHPFRSVNCVFCYSLLHNQPIKVFKGHIRTSTYIDDAINTFANITDNFKKGEVYNITSDYQHSIEELVKIVQKYTCCNPNLISYLDDSEILTTKVKLTNADKIKKYLGHKNSVSLDEGVKRTIKWMKNFYNIS